MDSEYEVRQLKTTDRVKVVELFQTIVQDPSASRFHPHDFSDDQADFVCGYPGKDLYLGAFNSQSKLVAYGLLRGWDEGFETPSLGIYVAPEARGTGVSTGFMEALHRAAARAGAKKVMLNVYADNTKAVALYQRIGYRFMDDSHSEQLRGYLDL